MVSWLRNAHAMETQAIQILKNQARRICNDISREEGARASWLEQPEPVISAPRASRGAGEAVSARVRSVRAAALARAA